jgi:putative ABC transport system ATP-binding protein
MIEIKNLNKTFFPNTPKAYDALKDINLSIQKGAFIILKGVSGSGKSTLLSILATLQKPSEGEVRIEGVSVAKLPDLHASHFRARSIGFVPQNFNLFEHFSIQENIATALIPLGLSPAEIAQKSTKALEEASITHKKDAYVSTLSGGEKQRAAIARALANDAPILLCDEPTANLDAANTEKFIMIIKALKERGKTIIIATHDPRFDTLDFCDKIYHLNEGRLR